LAGKYNFGVLNRQEFLKSDQSLLKPCVAIIVQPGPFVVKVLSHWPIGMAVAKFNLLENTTIKAIATKKSSFHQL
jgi:hypothetical protein